MTWQELLRRWLAGRMLKAFPMWQRLGLNVTQNDYYSPIPDVRSLRPDLWSVQTELVGVSTNEAKQLELLSKFVELYKTEYDSLPLERGQVQDGGYYINNGNFECGWRNSLLLHSVLQATANNRDWDRL
jgi:hypothetical protein